MLCKVKDTTQGGKNTQVRIIIFYVFLVIFCSFRSHYVDCGHDFVDSVKKELGSWLSGPSL